MAMIPEILQKGAPVLRQKAREVPIADIRGVKIRKLLKDMADALGTQDDGIALAAPQIGISLRIFIVAKVALKLPEKLQERRSAQHRAELKRKEGYLAFINPVVTKLSKDKAVLDEGCLSVRPLYGKIQRSKKASVKAYDETGRLFERGSAGLLAQVFQHETDHLEGILFIDKATDVKELPSENTNATN